MKKNESLEPIKIEIEQDKIHNEIDNSNSEKELELYLKLHIANHRPG